MPHIKIEIDKDVEPNEVKIEVKDLNPIEAIKYMLGFCQKSIAMINIEPKSKIMKPSINNVVDINSRVN